MNDVAKHRIGQPSPLPFHLAAALATYQAAIIAAPKAHDPAFPWHDELKENLPDFSSGLDQDKLIELAYGRLKNFTSGLHKWQTHPFKRRISEPPTIWRHGSTRLLDFGACAAPRNPRDKTVIVVPSLINKSYILDLGPKCSLLRFLATQGLRVLLLDWGDPEKDSSNNDFSSYTYSKLLPAIKFATNNVSPNIGILGYCMGGTLAAGLLANERTGVSAFATIGSPWNFSANQGITSALRLMGADLGEDNISDILHSLGQSFGMIPSEVFQHMFATINPMQAAIKFAKFNKMDQSSSKAETFVAIEDWLADGVHMTAPAAKNLLIDWHIKNQTANGQWKLVGKTVDIAKIDIPTMMICGKKDCISPLNVASAMAENIPNSLLLTPELGHIGMITSESARTEVWRPLAKFFTKT